MRVNLRNVKYSIDEIKLMLKKYNIELISTYKNVKTKIVVRELDIGYMAYVTLGSILKSTSVSYFDSRNPYAIYNMNLWLKNNNKKFKIISKRYKGINYKVKIVCEKDGNIIHAYWNNVRRKNFGCDVL